MNYIDSFNKYVSTHKLKIGWHNSNANDQLKITISRNRDDGSKCDPLEALNELLMFIVVAVKEEGLKQQLPPEQIYKKIGGELVKSIQECIKSQGKLVWRGHVVNVDFPPLKVSTIKRKQRSGSPYVKERLMQWGDLVNNIGFSIV